jgi:transmembrane sensor
MSHSIPHYDSSPERPNAQEQAALEWLARLDRGLTPEQEAEFERWLAANSQHGEAFGEFDGTWSLLNRIRQTPEAAAAAGRVVPDPDAFAPRRRTWPRVLAWSAPLLAAAVVGGFFVTQRETLMHRPDVASGFKLAATSDSVSPRKLNLPDGSVVELNRDSAIEIEFTPRERRLLLGRGEAHFSVAKDATRPFVVRASAVDVRALGTAFNVHLQPEAVEVLVTEGKVRLNDEQGRSLLPETSSTPVPGAASTPASVAPGARALVAGEKVTIALMPRSIAVPQVAVPVVVPAADIGRKLAWQTRQLEFVSAPLAEMVAEFNRHNRQQLAIPDATLGAQRFGGTFRSDDVAGFVRLLETHFGIESERTGETITLRAAR